MDQISRNVIRFNCCKSFTSLITHFAKQVTLILFSLLILCPNILEAVSSNMDSYVSVEAIDGGFPLSVAGHTAPLYASSQDYPGVLRVLKLFQSDLKMVTGIEPVIAIDTIPKSKEIVIVGTIGKSPIIDALIQSNQLDVSDISGKWETFLIQRIEKPYPDVEQALVIAGSDKRGTIFGVFDLSEKIGVSPWYWWADVPVKKKDCIYIKPGRHTLGEPKVKYRGFFINDEAPALSNWAYEKFGGFNHEFYVNVFELLLRLKANHLWPGMWGKYFGSDPENPRLADEYGIVMGSSHCEPLLYNNDPGAGLWNSQTMGPWRYDINRENIYKV
ncbi:MAG TPA: glycosyl hydrolase 115 family protein, partial [Candidatus Marinimicrobia bacterium]|nr:glycosyl hydrolase 115 family protein [Candidatus Neomarinimicrobiota bacterium]